MAAHLHCWDELRRSTTFFDRKGRDKAYPVEENPVSRLSEGPGKRRASVAHHTVALTGGRLRDDMTDAMVLRPLLRQQPQQPRPVGAGCRERAGVVVQCT